MGRVVPGSADHSGGGSLVKILLAGDTHADINHLRFLCRKAVEHEVDLIIQVGDFGFGFPGAYDWNDVDDVLDEYDLDLWWLDGNHDRHDLLAARTGWAFAFRLGRHLAYLPRGHRFELDGCRFMAFGGAVSVDQDYRVIGRDWWPEEEVTLEQIEAALRVPGDVDVLLTHDSPVTTPEIETVAARWPVPDRLERSSANQRKLLNRLLTLNPGLVVHGHWHIGYAHMHHIDMSDRLPDNTYGTNSVWIVGLAHNGDPDESYTIIDTEDWKRK